MIHYISAERLTIARALLCKSEILILDDSASALDYATDAALRAAIGNLPGEMTTVMGWVDGKLMGLLVFSRHPEGRTEIEAIHSLPESWGTGLGAAMLEFALDETNATDVAGLWAFEKNARARRFYEKHGFRFTGETRVSEFDGAIEVRYERT